MSQIPARRNDPATSKAAAASVKTSEREQECLIIFSGVKQGTMAHPVLESLQDLSNDELRKLTGDAQTANISSRVSSLFRKGLIRLTENERVSDEGRMQQCHEYVPVNQVQAQLVINRKILDDREMKKLDRLLAKRTA